MTRLIVWLLEKDPSKRPPDYQAVLSALDGVDSPAGEPDSTGALTRSVLAAARAALQLGRGGRVRSLLEPLVSAHQDGWTHAGFLLAAALEDAQMVADARAILDDIAANAACQEDRVLALWNLGRLAEKECDPQRAIGIYSRIETTATPLFPMMLLEARIARLRGRAATPPA